MWQALQRGLVVAGVAASSVLAVVIPTPQSASAIVAMPHLPAVWGARLTGSRAYGAWSAPVTGPSALSTSAPSGGGTLGVAEDADGPLSKLRGMIAFDGGTVEAFADGGNASGAAGHMLALVRNSAGAHEVWAWGYNTSGQLGNGSLTGTNAPVKVLWSPRPGEEVEQLAVGLAHSLMLTRQGSTRRVYSWGVNTYGQLGIAALSMASTTRQTTPRQIDALTAADIVSIAAGHSHSAAAAADGTVWVWGWDAGGTSTAYGNLGVSGTTPRPVPVAMTDDSVNRRRATPTTYSISNNVLAVTTTERHHFDVGDTVVHALGDVELDGSRTITAVTATSYSVAAQPNVAFTPAVADLTAVLPSATPSAASLTSNVATLTVASGHDLRVGNVVDVAVGHPAYDGRRTITARAATSISFTSQANQAAAALPSPATVSFVDSAPVAVTQKVLTSNAVTLTVPSGHPFVANNVVNVDLGDPTFDGTWTLSSVTATTLRYSRTAANVAAAAVPSGTVTLLTPSVSATHLAITSNTAVLTADAAGPAHNFRTNNRVLVTGLGGHLDGVKTLSAHNTANGTLSFVAQPNLASTPVSGTVTMARDSDVIGGYSITNNTAAVTITGGHDFEIGNQIVVSGLGGSLDGPKTITGVAASTVSYLVRPNQTLTAASGTPAAIVADCSDNCPAAPSDVVEVAAGGAFTLARTASGQVISWGYINTNNYGRLGRTSVPTPLAVNLPAGCVAVRIAASAANGAAVCADRRVTTWGYNGRSNLGTNVAPPNTSHFVATPAVVVGITLAVGETIVDLVTEAAGMAVLTSTGAVWTWGIGAYNRLGKSGVTTDQRTAQLANRIKPTGGSPPVALFSVNHTTGVADANGAVWTWGYGRYGLAGRGVSGLTTMRFDRIGIDPTARITMWDTTYYSSVVVMSDGSMWTWGSNGGSTKTYFLGDGTTAGRLTPGKIELPVGIDTGLPTHTVTGLDCSYHHCLFTTSNGSIYGWGDAASQQLARFSKVDRTTPLLLISGLTNPRVAAGNGYSLYVDIGAQGTGGVVYAWGSNANRRASPTTTTNPLTTYTAVRDMTVPASPTTMNNVIAIRAGSAHSVALLADGTIVTWGLNTSGQMGAGNTLSSVTFRRTTLPGGAVAADIHAEGNHVLVRATDGRLFGWGRNAFGVLGSGGTANLLVPTHVATAHRFTQIDTSGHSTTGVDVQSTVGLTTTGQVLAWGSNYYGQLGRPERPNATSGINSFSATPVTVLTSAGTPITGVDRVVAGGFWSAAYATQPGPQTPSVPRNLAVTSPAPHTLAVNWDAPEHRRELVGYEITVRRAGEVVFTAGAGAAATSVTLAAPALDVVDGLPHSVEVRAVNAVGESDPAGPATATPLGLPTAPSSVEASSRIDGLDIIVNAPVDTGGSPVIDATVVATPVEGGDAVSVTVAWTSSPLTTSLTTGDGLVLGVEYAVEVTVRNAVGPSPATLSNAVVPGRPTAPRSVVAAGRPGAAYVTWDAPERDGGLAVRSYAITAYSQGTRTAIATEVVTDGIFEVTVGGLADGSVYDIEVRASQAEDAQSGLGARSLLVEVTAGRPVAPTGVTVQRSAPGTLTITWSAVTDVPGIAITGYQVRLDDGTTVSTTSVSCATPECSSTRSGLVNGRPYRVQVAAVGGGGDGPWSTSASAAPRTSPGAPAALTTEPSNGSASLSFDPPADDGGDTLDGYVVEITPSAGGAAVWSGTVDALTTGVAVEGLTNGQSYNVSVRARNGAGLSPPSTTTVVPATTPGPPRRIRVRPGSIVVEWDAPADNGGASVSHYEITATDADGMSTTVATSAAADCSTSTRYCRITTVYTSASPEVLVAIPEDMEYRITVVAVNAQGAGDSPDEVILVAAQPSEPVAVATTAGSRSVAVCWSPPLYLPAAKAVTAYRLTLTADGESFEVVVPVAELDDDHCSAPAIGHRVDQFADGSRPQAGVTYTVQVAASVSSQDYIFGLASLTSTVTPYTTPSAPTSATMVATSSGSVTVAWAAGPDGGSPITGYTVTAQPGGEVCSWTSGPLECTIDNLSHDTAYTFDVVATNAAGEGSFLRTAALTIDAQGPIAQWTSITVVSETLVELTLGFDEPVLGLATDDIDVITQTDCTWELDVITDRTAVVSLSCAPGDVQVRLRTSAVTDALGNGGPGLALDAPVITFTAAAVPVVSAPIAPIVPPLSETPDPPPAVRADTAPTTQTSARFDIAGVCLGRCGVQASLVELVFPSTLEVRGDGLAPGSTLTVWLYSDPVMLGQLVVDSGGQVDDSVDIPAVEPGEHTLEVTGTDETGTSFVLRVRSTVSHIPAAGPPASLLPATGTTPIPALALALVLIAAGWGCGRRRRVGYPAVQ